MDGRGHVERDRRALVAKKRLVRLPARAVDRASRGRPGRPACRRAPRNVARVVGGPAALPLDVPPSRETAPDVSRRARAEAARLPDGLSVRARDPERLLSRVGTDARVAPPRRLVLSSEPMFDHQRDAIERGSGRRSSGCTARRSGSCRRRSARRGRFTSRSWAVSSRASSGGGPSSRGSPRSSRRS